MLTVCRAAAPSRSIKYTKGELMSSRHQLLLLSLIISCPMGGRKIVALSAYVEVFFKFANHIIEDNQAPQWKHYFLCGAFVCNESVETNDICKGKDERHERTCVWLYPGVDEGAMHRPTDAGDAGGVCGEKGCLY